MLVFLNFCTLAFVGFPLFSKDAFFMLSCFFLFALFPDNSTFHSWFDCYILCCFYLDSNKVFIFIIQSVSFRCLLKTMSFRCVLKTMSFRCLPKVSNLVLDCIYQNWQVVSVYLFVSYFCKDLGEFWPRWCCEWKIFLQKRSIPHNSVLLIHFFMNT